jgi:hypothetical protein
MFGIENEEDELLTNQLRKSLRKSSSKRKRDNEEPSKGDKLLANVSIRTLAHKKDDNWRRIQYT